MTIHKRDLRRSQRILYICLFRHSVQAFCLLRFQGLYHLPGLRLVTINETKARHCQMELFYSSFRAKFGTPSAEKVYN